MEVGAKGPSGTARNGAKTVEPLSALSLKAEVVDRGVSLGGPGGTVYELLFSEILGDGCEA